MEKFFKLKERNTTVKTEILAGLTTFMAMAYILMVNAGMLGSDVITADGIVLYDAPGYGAVYIATALSAVIGTVLIGLLANIPMAQASGMGLNAYFVYTVCVGMGFTYANALVMILLDGIVFILLTATGLRKKIFEGIPKSVRVAIPAGIGLFIAFIGMQNVHLVVDDGATLVNLHSFNIFSDSFSWAVVMPIVVAILALLAIGIMSQRKVKGAVLYGILGGAALYYLLGLTVPGFYDAFSLGTMNPFDAFAEFGKNSFAKVFTEGFDFSVYLSKGNSVGSLVFALITSALAFCLVDMFDTIGTLYGACARGNLLTEEGEVPEMNKAMLADAIATTTGAICGTSTVTTFVESSAGVAEGGRTGLTSMSTAFFFFVAMFLSPVASLIPGCATAAALIYVGVLMMNCVKDIDWLSPAAAVPAFLTVSIMAFTYNISYGIAFGIISALIINIFTGKIKETKATTWVIAILFIAMFLVSH